MRVARLTAGALTLAAFFVSAHAVADTGARARFHDDLARRFYDRGQYEEAIREFFIEQELAPNPRIVFNIALCFDELGRSQDAYMLFDEYLASADDSEERKALAQKRLERLAKKLALVRVTSSPPGARIYVDDKAHGDHGVTPRTIVVAPGARKVWVELDGHRPASVAVDATLGEQRSTDLAPTRILGRLELSSNVSGTAFVRTGAGELAAQGELPLDIELPPGIYDVTVRAPGHTEARSVVNVREDEVTTQTIVPNRRPPSTGDITVTTNVSGALIELDGRVAGFSPTVLSSVGVGQHELNVNAQGMQAWKGAVIVRPEERSWVTVTLQEPPSVQRSPATWVAAGVATTALLGAGLFGYLAGQAHSDFQTASDAQRRELLERGQTYNLTADVLLVTGLLATAGAVGLYFGTAERSGGPSSASVARGKR